MENEKHVMEFLDENYARLPEIHDAYEQLRQGLLDLIKERILPVLPALGIDVKKAKAVKYFERNAVWGGYNNIKHPLMWDLQGGVVFEEGKIILKIYVDIKREGVDYKTIVNKIERALPQDIMVDEVKTGHLLYICYKENAAQYPAKELAARLTSLCEGVQKALAAAFK